VWAVAFGRPVRRQVELFLSRPPLDQVDQVETGTVKFGHVRANGAVLLEAIRSARKADRSWSEIGAMLGVSKQAAQHKYATRAIT
jgi:hypothetical protein